MLLAAACQIRELFFFGNRHFLFQTEQSYYSTIFIGELAPNYQWFTGAHAQRLVSLSATWYYFGVLFRRFSAQIIYTQYGLLSLDLESVAWHCITEVVKLSCNFWIGFSLWLYATIRETPWLFAYSSRRREKFFPWVQSPLVFTWLTFKSSFEALRLTNFYWSHLACESGGSQAIKY